MPPKAITLTLITLLLGVGACKQPEAPVKSLSRDAPPTPHVLQRVRPDVAGAIGQAQARVHRQMRRAKRLSTLTPLVLDTAEKPTVLTESEEAARLLELALKTPQGRKILREALLGEKRQEQSTRVQRELDRLSWQVQHQQQTLAYQSQQLRAHQQQPVAQVPAQRPSSQMERVAFGQERRGAAQLVWGSYGTPGWFPQGGLAQGGAGAIWSQELGQWVQPVGGGGVWSPCTLRSYEGVRPCDQGLVKPPSKRPLLIPAANTLPRQIPRFPL